MDYDHLHENTTQTKQVYASIIIPVYNQEKNIPYLLEKIKESLTATMQTYEVIVVNDGSYDNTLSILINQHKFNPHLRVFSYAENRGKGAGDAEGRGREGQRTAGIALPARL